MRQWINLCESPSPASVVREEMLKLGNQMGIAVDIALQDDHELSLENLRVPDDHRRQGLASQFMQLFCERCDDHNITVHVYPEPYEKNMEPDELRAFYQGFGFHHDEDGGYMVRS